MVKQNLCSPLSLLTDVTHLFIQHIDLQSTYAPQATTVSIQIILIVFLVKFFMLILSLVFHIVCLCLLNFHLARPQQQNSRYDKTLHHKAVFLLLGIPKNTKAQQVAKN